MTRTDYYRVLGVPRSASAHAIRKAYLALVRELHPDLVGSAGTARFQEINEAYEVLSDPAARRRYDRRIAGFDAVPHHWTSRPGPFSPEPISVLDEPEAVRPSVDEVYDRFLRTFRGQGIPKSERPEGFDIGVILSSEEAARGTDLTIGVPVLAVCPECAGTGGYLFPCLRCGQLGRVEREAAVRVRIPPGVRDGAVLMVPLERIGARNFYLRVHVAVRRRAPIW